MNNNFLLFFYCFHFLVFSEISGIQTHTKSNLLKTGWVGSSVDLTQPNIPIDWHELTRLFLRVKKSWVGVKLLFGICLA